MRVSQSVMESIDRMRREGRIVEHDAQARAEPLVDSISEEDFQAEVIKFAKKHGWLCYHTRISKKSEAGFPDLVLIRGPALIVAELKVGENTPTAPQQTWLEGFRGAGVQTYVWYPRDFATIVSLLE